MNTEMPIRNVICPHCQKPIEDFHAFIDGYNNVPAQVVNCLNDGCLKNFVIDGINEFTGDVYKIEKYPDPEVDG